VPVDATPSTANFKKLQSGSRPSLFADLRESLETEKLTLFTLSFYSSITMLNAQQGARIKVFGGSGYVKNITFSDFHSELLSFVNSLLRSTLTSFDFPPSAFS
jgi:hypothetical protein